MFSNVEEKIYHVTHKYALTIFKYLEDSLRNNQVGGFQILWMNPAFQFSEMSTIT
jgi:hypothetical protein